MGKDYRSFKSINFSDDDVKVFQSYSNERWTEDELDTIKKYGPTMTARKISEKFLPNRWYADIRSKRYRMGIKITSSAIYNNRWTPEEDRILEEYGSSVAPDALMMMIPAHTKGAIMTRRCKKGIKYV